MLRVALQHSCSLGEITLLSRVGLSLTVCSYDQGVFGGILQLQNYREQFNHPTDTETGIIVSSYCLGALAGCVLNIFIGDYFGRRKMVSAEYTFQRRF